VDYRHKLASTLNNSDKDNYLDIIPNSDFKVEIDSVSITNSKYNSDSIESVS
jgi:hypothetical protein